ncbi:spermidine synthase [Simiduia agarivorans]|uniref:Spermidine synthase n=1 Tax=Simiduia agarivorans (strain DSM 21679 / JCM 13881 / BCRC 17597 / SA1) TaxID=1117647 RepID=K4KU92_SIMAS|nr:putative spermidine synthase [Simiduia agarivorans]AFU97537.1 putative spermidine synthase [Simiduia agarivorans SA1 = DSM 21679]
MSELAAQLKYAIDRLRRTQVFHTRDEQGDLYVYEQNGKRLLTFDEKFEQSVMDLRRPHRPEHRYIRAMLLPLAFDDCRRALHLGLGGGALVRSLHKLAPTCQQTAVELRGGVRRVCATYFLDDPSLAVKVVADDAFRYIQAVEAGRFDYISSDLYLASGMDIKQASESYIRACASALSEQGWLALNFTRLPGYRDPVFESLKRHFEELVVVSVDALNYVILAGKTRLTRPLMGFAPQVRNMGELLEVNLMQQLKQAQQAKSFFHETE